jgi:hypothetical protein
MPQVEDVAGLRLADTKKEGTCDYTTHAHRSFINPKDMVDRAGTIKNAPSQAVRQEGEPTHASSH